MQNRRNHLKRNCRRLNSVVWIECLKLGFVFLHLYNANIFSTKLFQRKAIGRKILVFSVFLFKYSRVDIAHLCLYNLSVIHKKKYFDSELELMAYINENWDRLHPGEVSK